MIDTKNVKEVYKKGYAKKQAIIHNPRLAKVLSIAQTIIPKNKERMLDAGCGDGSFTRALGETLHIRNIYGIDIASDAVRTAKSNRIHAKLLDTDTERFPFPSSYFDFIYCGSLVEVVADADRLLKEIHRTLKKNGVVIMTFPNIAVWLSRIALLLGYLPYYSRVSTRFDLGKMFLKIKKGQSTGFIRLFTLSSFIELTRLYGLSVKETYGVPERTLPFPFYFIDSLISKKPSLASQIICVLTKK